VPAAPDSSTAKPSTSRPPCMRMKCQVSRLFDGVTGLQLDRVQLSHVNIIGP